MTNLRTYLTKGAHRRAPSAARSLFGALLTSAWLMLASAIATRVIEAHR